VQGLVTKLSPLVYSLATGAVFSIAASVFVALFSGSDLPRGWVLGLASSILLGGSGLGFARLAIQAADLDRSQSTISEALSGRLRDEALQSTVEEAEGAMKRTAVVTVVSILAGLALLPARVAV
jgi:hypothetical protein